MRRLCAASGSPLKPPGGVEVTEKHLAFNFGAAAPYPAPSVQDELSGRYRKRRDLSKDRAIEITALARKIALTPQVFLYATVPKVKICSGWDGPKVNCACWE